MFVFTAHVNLPISSLDSISNLRLTIKVYDKQVNLYLQPNVIPSLIEPDQKKIRGMKICFIIKKRHLIFFIIYFIICRYSEIIGYVSTGDEKTQIESYNPSRAALICRILPFTISTSFPSLKIKKAGIDRTRVSTPSTLSFKSCGWISSLSTSNLNYE